MSTQSGSRLPAWCAGLEDSMERMAQSLDREVTGWTGPDTVFVPEDYGYIPGEKPETFLIRLIIHRITIDTCHHGTDIIHRHPSLIQHLIQARLQHSLG